MPKQMISAKQLRTFAKEVGIKSIVGYTKTKAIKAIISRTKITSQYSIAFRTWYKQLDDKLFDKKDKISIIPKLNVFPKLKVFSVETYRNCDIDTSDHQSKIKCTFPTGDSFEFSIDIGTNSFKAEFNCLYYTKEGKGVVLYRGEPSSHIQAFWNDLGNEYHKRTSGYQDELRNRVLDEFDFNWEGDI